MTGRTSCSWAWHTRRKNGSWPGRGQKSSSRYAGLSSRSNARRQNTQPSTRSGWMSLVSLIGKYPWLIEPKRLAR